MADEGMTHYEGQLGSEHSLEMQLGTEKCLKLKEMSNGRVAENH